MLVEWNPTFFRQRILKQENEFPRKLADSEKAIPNDISLDESQKNM